jgi:hypothetical protein
VTTHHAGKAAAIPANETLGVMTTSSRIRRTPAVSEPAPAIRPAGTPLSHLQGAASYLPQVLPVFEKLSALLGRPARVLDLGPDPDYFAHHLGDRGAKVTTASLHAVADGESCDLVLSLGTGLPSDPVDRSLLAAIGKSAGVLLTDSHAIHRVSAVLREHFSFAHDLPSAGRGPHPVCFASDRYWLLDGTMMAFDSFSVEPHPLLRGLHLGTRRYYVGSGTIAKVYDLDQTVLGSHNRAEWEGEARYLRHVPPGLSAPALIASGERNGEAWLARQYIEGRALLSLIEDGAPYDPAAILRDLLVELAALERAGLYHRDVRLWNVIVRPDGRATLVDHGAITPEPASCSAPTNLFASFMVFAHEVFARTSLWRRGSHLPKFRLDLPEPFGGALRAMLLTPPAQWSFARLLHDVDTPSPPPAGALAGFEILLAAAGECSDALDTQDDALAAARREAELRHRADLGDATIASMLGSTSWRVTAPLRAFGRLIGRVTGRRH